MDFDHAPQIIETAATTAVHGVRLCRMPNRPIRTHVECYWQASKRRQARWTAGISLLERKSADVPDRWATRWRWRLEGLIEEILASDVFTRVSAQVIRGLAEPWWSDLSCFADSVMLGQEESRARVLRLLLDSPLLDEAEARRLDTFRRATERWTDVLLGYLKLDESHHALAFDTHRVREFEATLYEGNSKRRQAALSLLLQGVAQGARRLCRARCPHPTLNRHVAQSILSCLGPDLLDAVGLHARLWETRVQRNAHEISYWLGHLQLDPAGGQLPSC